MTLNECRSILMARYPGRTVCVEATCWHHASVMGTQGFETTKFRASIFAERTGLDIGEIERSVDGYTLDELLAQLKGTGTDRDAVAVAMEEQE